jgi:hypothetical protein
MITKGNDDCIIRQSKIVREWLTSQDGISVFLWMIIPII